MMREECREKGERIENKLKEGKGRIKSKNKV